MTKLINRWSVAVIGLVIGVLMAAATLGSNRSPAEAALSFGIVATYTIALQLLRSRSDVASLLTGLPRDERWETINMRALALAAQVMAIVLLIAFLVTQFRGGDALAYAWPGALFAVAYLGGIAWYRARS
jgi:Na+/H+ antiporter NhaD/arsenite permease-like protein